MDDTDGAFRVRRADDRGLADFGWLKSRHSFSFGEYHDPAHMGFSSLRVINDDRVDPGQGFGTHPHRDMEIISYVVAGELEHQDSLGNGSVIRPGDVQRLSAGTGIRHSEFNPSPDNPVHFLQIWILPRQPGLEPSYEQKRFERADKLNRLCLIGARDGRDGAVTVQQDLDLYAAVLDPGAELTRAFDPARRLWIQIISGDVTANGTRLTTGDGASITGAASLTLQAASETELLAFDLS